MCCTGVEAELMVSSLRTTTLVGKESGNGKSLRRLFNHNSPKVVMAKDLYLPLLVDLESMVCFINCHEPKNKHKSDCFPFAIVCTTISIRKQAVLSNTKGKVQALTNLNFHIHNHFQKLNVEL